MQWIRTHKAKPGEQALYRTALIITICGNVLLLSIKWKLPYLSGSVALFADAANSGLTSCILSDGFWSLGGSTTPRMTVILRDTAVCEPLVGLMITVSMTLPGMRPAKASIERLH